MGHVLHHAIVVTSWESVAMAAARRKAEDIGLSVTPLASSGVNSYLTFTVVPDGSKSGWQDSDDGDARRDAFIAWLRQQRHGDGSNAIEWVEVSYGSDDREAQVTRHEWQDAPAASAIAAAPEAPAWREKLDAAAAEIGDEHSYALSIALSDVDYDLRTVRDFAFALREQVESHARRIEALERANNKEERK